MLASGVQESAPAVPGFSAPPLVLSTSAFCLAVPLNIAALRKHVGEHAGSRRHALHRIKRRQNIACRLGRTQSDVTLTSRQAWHIGVERRRQRRRDRCKATPTHWPEKVLAFGSYTALKSGHKRRVSRTPNERSKAGRSLGAGEQRGPSFGASARHRPKFAALGMGSLASLGSIANRRQMPLATRLVGPEGGAEQRP